MRIKKEELGDREGQGIKKRTWELTNRLTLRQGRVGNKKRELGKELRKEEGRAGNKKRNREGRGKEEGRVENKKKRRNLETRKGRE
ncbi:MAG: hypothetical protein KF890_14270 [Nitrospira sp.]|nr:hypothetical protein [Nitrospira sp.]